MEECKTVYAYDLIAHKLVINLLCLLIKEIEARLNTKTYFARLLLKYTVIRDIYVTGTIVNCR